MGFRWMTAGRVMSFSIRKEREGGVKREQRQRREGAENVGEKGELRERNEENLRSLEAI